MSVGGNFRKIFSLLAQLGRKTELTNGCIIGAMCEVTSQEVIPENTVIYGAKCERRVQSERPPVGYHYFITNTYDNKSALQNHGEFHYIMTLSYYTMGIQNVINYVCSRFKKYAI